MKTEVVRQQGYLFKVLKKTTNCASIKKEPEIIALIKEGKDGPTIAKIVGLTTSTIKKVASRNNLTVKRASRDYGYEERNEAIKKLLLKNVNLQVIADKFNVTRQRIEQIAKTIGIRRQEENREKRSQLIQQIKVDISSGLSYSEILKKHKLDYKSLNSLYRHGLPNLFRIFRNKRNEIIIDEYAKGKTAEEILNSKNKFLTGELQVSTVDYIYGIVTKNKFRKYPQIGNRSKGGLFEDARILNYIKTWKEDHKRTFGDIADILNKKGEKTITGKPFTQQLVYNKYNRFIEQEKKNKRKRK
jgi:hypothetical protein